MNHDRQESAFAAWLSRYGNRLMDLARPAGGSVTEPPTRNTDDEESEPPPDISSKMS